MRSRQTLFSLLALMVALSNSGEAQTVGYYRYPAIHSDTVVFTAEGDLWKIRLGNSQATRLTTHLEQELHAAISPDGKSVAFSASYEGPTEVYVISIEGGQPQRLTYDGESARVVGWTPDGRVCYATRHYSTLPNTQLVLVHPQTKQVERIELDQASQAEWLQKQMGLVFTRLSKQGSSTKRYHGGSVENLWKYVPGEDEAIALTADYTGTSRSPMLHDDRIYFNTDRDGTLNIWSMDLEGKDLKQHTNHKGFDCLRPDLHDGRIVYQLGADLRILDLTTDQSGILPITLSSDFEQRREFWVESPEDYLDSYSLSNDGEKLALAFHGDVFVVPVNRGRTVHLTLNSSARYRSLLFQSESDKVLALADESGEYEVWSLPSDGLAVGAQVTKNGKIFRFQPVASPDGKWLAFTDKNHHLWITDLESGKQERIGISDYGNFYDLAWSPDSRWLAYAKSAENWTDQIWLWSLQKKEAVAVTTDRADSYDPAWSPEGKFLYFLSDRHLNSSVASPWGPRQPEPYFDKTTLIYELALQDDISSPFRELTELDTEQDTEEDTEEEEPGEPAFEIEIDFENIMRRIRKLPVVAGNYSELTVTENHLYWVSATQGTSPSKSLKSRGRKFEAEVLTVASSIDSYALSTNAKYVALRKSGSFYVFAANGKSGGGSDDLVSLRNVKFSVDPVKRWRQMLMDAWRLERDYFYDPNLHGVKWKDVLDLHLALVDRLTDRAELNDLLEQMVGELEALHIYVRGGQQRMDGDNVGIGSLGAVLRHDRNRKGYVVEHIYISDPDYPQQLSPLAHPDVQVAEQSVIRTVNGIDVNSVSHINVLLREQIGRQVLLEVAGPNADDEVRRVIVRPISMSREADLRYDQWEFSRRLAVEKASQKQIGYVHLRAMGKDNIAEWTREFYPVYNRPALIVDVRHNRGGNIDSWILEKLGRQAWFYWQPRVGKPYWNMQYAFRGHMVVLCNERTASDGEAFAEGFRRLGYGVVIGTRTWGGEIWLSINNRLVDKGYASAAQSGVFGPEGKWLIEGHGVDPDIVVDNLPHATFNGQDAQLDTAIKYLQQKLKDEPIEIPMAPPYPVRPGTKKTPNR